MTLVKIKTLRQTISDLYLFGVEVFQKEKRIDSGIVVVENFGKEIVLIYNILVCNGSNIQ